MTIKQSVLKKISESKRIKNLLSLAFDKTPRTIENWCESNDPMLTTVVALEVIRKELNLSDKQIFNS